MSMNNHLKIKVIYDQTAYDVFIFCLYLCYVGIHTNSNALDYHLKN